MTNTNVRGSSMDRQRRKMYLLETYAADRDALSEVGGHDIGWDRNSILACKVGTGISACRCYRCGCLLTYETLTVDRIVPGCKGGTYRRTNIRPSCSSCATETGNELKKALKS